VIFVLCEKINYDNIVKKIALFLIAMILTFPSCYPETIKLKNGKTIEAKIIEKTNEYIKIDLHGVPLTYYIETIESIDGVALSAVSRDIRLPQVTAVDSSSDSIDIVHIRKLLKELGYPERTWLDIERELLIFLNNIDLPRLKSEATRVKSNPAQLKDFVSRIGELIEQKGYLNIESPHLLMKLLINSFGSDDIFHIIDTSPTTFQEKNRLKTDVVACSAVSQLGSIILELLDTNVKVAFAPQHVYNCIPFDGQRVLFIDFSNQLFKIIDTTQYYKLEGKYLLLKEKYRISPERMRQIEEQWPRGVRTNTLEEIFHYLYFYIYITDTYSATPVIYNNRGKVYFKQNNFTKAILDYTKAIEANSHFAEAYANRGLAYIKHGDTVQAFSDFARAIEINPNLAEAYSNRGFAYLLQDNFSQAISNCSKAIEINPNLAIAYHNRGVAYFMLNKFDKAWGDVHKVQNLGSQINPEFMQKLRNASGRNR